MGPAEIAVMLSLICGAMAVQTEGSTREAKILPVFQVVRFPNDPCQVSGGAKNGTCYTSEECLSKGGLNAGSCASGFGVCCTFTVGCGSTSSENCTYFEGSNLRAGQCRSKICKCSSDICQFRLDFTTFTITGPSTLTVSVAKQSLGAVQLLAGKAISFASRCSTDQFSVSNAPSLPMICGRNTGEHVYFDASDACHDLSFAFGQAGVGATIPTRAFNIKITQYSCNHNNLAPPGCTQYFYGNAATGVMKSFNFDGGLHLADQRHVTCVRREAGNCKVCWSADAPADVQLSGKNSKAIILQSSCCAYGVDNAKSTGVFDCLMFPGAIKAANNAVVGESLCGGKGGVNSASTMTGITLCSKAIPFRIEFYSDSYEQSISATADGATPGYKIRYFQAPC